MDTSEPERLSASKSAFARGFTRRHVQDSANPRASPGGTPEPFDDGLAATLAREAFEENQVRIGPGPVYLGYQEVHEPGRPLYAQIRMAGIITEFAPRAPDPDNGRINRRRMTSLASAPGMLGWGSPPRPRPSPLPGPGAPGACPLIPPPPTDTRTRPMPAVVRVPAAARGQGRRGRWR